MHRGRRFSPHQQGVKLFVPCPARKGGDDVVTFSELFQFCTFIVSLISLIIEIILLTKKEVTAQAPNLAVTSCN